MKYIKKLLIIFFCFIHCSCAFAQNNYSSAAIQTYNLGVALHNQRKYELAEEKYNQTLKLQPNFIEAKNNLSVIYPNLAYKYYSETKYEKAIYYAKKSIELNPKNIDSYSVLAQSYEAINDKEKEILTYNKIFALTPQNTDALHSIGQIYLKSNELDKASLTYQKILTIKPNDSIAKQNLHYANYYHTEKVINQSLNNLKVEHTAPTKLYKLIKPEAGIMSSTIKEMESILDLVWSEPNGRTLLQSMIENKVRINIIQYASTANAMKSSQTRTFYLYGFIPVASFTSSSTAVNIPFSYIKNFNNQNLDAYQRIFNLHVFIHEFGHAYIGIKNPQRKNSIEEELGVSMIGYNVAHKIITGKYLDKAQTEKYSQECLQSLLSDQHRELPVYSGFNKDIQFFGVALPYPEVYSNLPLMYTQLLSEKKVQPAPTFYPYTR